MNKDIIRDNWKMIKGKIKQQWGRLTEDDVSTMKGSYNELQNKIQSAYGYQTEQAKREIDIFIKRYDLKV